jgi:hypothetical protein
MNITRMRYGRAAALVLVGAPIMAIAGSSQTQNAGPTEAVERQNIRFVPIKTDDQLDLQAADERTVIWKCIAPAYRAGSACTLSVCPVCR